MNPKNQHQLVQLLSDAGLDGRGGAGFSTAVKIGQAIENRADLIVNACDGELGADKDELVLVHRLDQVRRAVELIAPPRLRVAVHRGSPAEAVVRRAGLEVLTVPRRYVSSEASALVSLANGGLAKPFTKRQRLAIGARDLQGRRLPPTLVLNAETMLRIAEIAEHGPEWFRSFGTDTEPGPRLVTITGAVSRPGVYEAEAGLPLSRVLSLAGPVADGPVHAGGLAGGWVPAGLVGQTTWSRPSLAARGASIGAATLVVLEPQTCPLSYGASLLEYAAGESAGQCGPCMFGIPAAAANLRSVVDGQLGGLTALQRRLPLLPGRGACSFPDGVALFLASTLEVFAEHVDEHLADGCALRPVGATAADHEPLANRELQGA